MLKKILAPALGALAAAALAAGAAAQYDQPQQPYGQPQYPQQQQQPYPEQQPQQPYPAQQPYQQQYPQAAPQVPQACVRLEAQLATLNTQGPNPQQQQLEQSYNQQRAQMDAMIAKSRGMGCGRNFLFGPRPSRECRGLEDQIDRMRDSVERLEDQLRRGRGDAGLTEARRRDIIAALAHHRCGPQYEAAAPREERRGGLFGFLFGGSRGGFREQYPSSPAENIQTSTYRTVCVRTCDGFFFPVSFATVSARFPQDENMCRRTCPGAEAMLFSYPNPGGSIEQATSTTGQPYTSLPNAFKYQTEYVKDCSCKPAGMTWEQALAGAEDGTLQRGDIVVDEERAKAMSQPEGGGVTVSPSEASQAAQQSQTAVTGEGVVEGAANTEIPPGFDAAPPAANTAEPYYVPPPKRERPDPRYLPPQFR